MRAALRLLNEAAAAAPRAFAQEGSRGSRIPLPPVAPRRDGNQRRPQNRPGRMSAADINSGSMGSNPKVRYLVVDVPATALPTDVLRAMREVGAVDKSFPLTSIVHQPVGAKRKASLLTRYHITTPDRPTAEKMYQILSSRPLFAAGSARASAQPGRPAYGNGTGTKDDARVFFTHQNAHEWADKMYLSTKSGLMMDYLAAERDAEKIGGLPNAEWALQPNQSGRRVMLRGFPINRPANLIKDFVRDIGVEFTEIKRGPPVFQGSRGIWIVGCNNVAEAHYLARRCNQVPFNKTILGSQFMLRAHVVW